MLILTFPPLPRITRLRRRLRYLMHYWGTWVLSIQDFVKRASYTCCYYHHPADSYGRKHGPTSLRAWRKLGSRRVQEHTYAGDETFWLVKDDTTMQQFLGDHRPSWLAPVVLQVVAMAECLAFYGQWWVRKALATSWCLDRRRRGWHEGYDCWGLWWIMRVFYSRGQIRRSYHEGTRF